MGKRILLFGLPQITSNFGCEALICGTGAIVKQTNPNYQTVYVSDGHAKIDRDRLGMSSPIEVVDSAPRFGPRFFARRLMRRLNLSEPGRRPLPPHLLNKADGVLSVGGDLYTFAEKESDWPYPYSIVKDGNAIMDKGVPYIIWCASVGPLEKAGERLGFIVEHLRRCKAIIVREPGSFEYLTNVLSLKENVYLAADPAFLMETVPFDAPFFSNSQIPILAFNFSLAPIEHVHGSEDYDKLFKRYVKIIEGIIDDLGVRVLLVPHVYLDYEFLRKISDEISSRHKEHVWMLPVNLGAKRTKWAVSQSDGLISMRFHCALAGFGTCTPTVIVSSTAKGEKIAKDTYGDNSDKCILPLKDFNFNEVKEKAEFLLNNRESLCNALQVNLKKMQERALYAGEVIRKVL